MASNALVKLDLSGINPLSDVRFWAPNLTQWTVQGCCCPRGVNQVRFVPDDVLKRQLPANYATPKLIMRVDAVSARFALPDHPNIVILPMDE